MKSLFNPNHTEGLVKRIKKLSLHSIRRWGKMTIHEAIIHMSDGLRIPLGKKNIPAIKHHFSNPLIKNLIIFVLPWPRGANSLVDFSPTKSSNLENDKAELIRLTHSFPEIKNYSKQFSHPVFGKMSLRQWGRHGYRHLDHHLKQFSV